MLLPLVLLALALAGPMAPAAARRHAPSLREDEPARRTIRPAECQFGKQPKELGSMWYADLGPPFGVMYCILCECAPVQKKRRLVAKVHCRNIKKECPVPSCDEPVLLPGRCCKVCPGDLANSPDLLLQDSPVMIFPDNEENLSMKHFGALLTGRSPLCIRRDDMTGVPVAQGVATARFIFRRRHLYWSVLLGSSVTAQPRALSFLDREGRMLIEHPLAKAPGIHATYEEKTDKLCGVWRRVPKEYKRLLRDGSLFVALIWGDAQNNTMDSALSGRIDRYPALASEMFTSLLEPENPPDLSGANACNDHYRPGQQEGWGGTAVVTGVAGAAPSLHIAVAYNGVFSPSQGKEQLVRVLLSLPDKNETIIDETRQEGCGWGGTAVVTGVAGAAPSLHIAVAYNGVFSPSQGKEQLVRVLLSLPDKNETIIDEVQKVNKPNYELNVLEVSTPVSAAELRSLSRGRLQLSVEDLNTPDRRISGKIRQRAACEVYHAPLVTERLPATIYPEGLAMLYIDKEGSLVYDIQAHNLNVVDPKITLVEEQGKRHSQVEILDTRSGVLARPSARIFPPLYDDQLAVHISGDMGPSLLRGRLVSRPVPDAAGGPPALLRRTETAPPAADNPPAGLVWISVDALCGLHYEVVITGNAGAWTAWLDTLAVEGGGVRPLLGVDGCVLEPTAAELGALHLGSAFLSIRSTDNITVVLNTILPKITVPASCLDEPFVNSKYSNTFVKMVQTDRRLSDMNSLLKTTSCFYKGQLYADGSQWTVPESCLICGCVHGDLRCDAVRCPPVDCTVPTITPPGQCCPICTNSTTAVWNESHGCHLAGQYHAPGSSWHPYLVPEGYDTCAVCTCEFSTRQVRCPRVRCPPLRCAEKDAYRPDKKACCRVCPEEKPKKADELTPKDQGAPRTAEEILAEGGCRFPDGPLPNGAEVHPSIHSHGEQRCVTCRCKDGEVTCIRKRCSRVSCARRKRGDACCACTRHRRQRPPRPAPPPPSPS